MTEKTDHVVSPRVYIAVLAALMVLLIATLIAAFVDFDQRLHGGYWNMSLAVLIAIGKAVLIILFFMHVKYASRVTWAFAAAGFLWLAILLTLTFTDYGTRAYPTELQPTGRTSPSVTK
jgi:cytochrome c oxidase subunit 4